MLYQLSYASNSTTTSPEAGDGTRTRDHKLGRLVLYQLSYSRKTDKKTRPLDNGGGRIRTFEGVSRQIYSLLPLATWVPHPNPDKTSRPKPGARRTPDPRSRADGRNRTGNLLITNQLLCQLSYVSKQRFFASLQ